MQQIALAWLVYRLTGSPFMLGLVTFAGNIPILLLAPFGGVWSDRLNRRRAMLLTQALSLLQAAVLAGLTFAGLVEVWHLLVAAAFLGIVNASTRRCGRPSCWNWWVRANTCRMPSP
jgi:MFS family permease